MVEPKIWGGMTMVRTNGVGWLGLFIAWGTTALAGVDEGLFRDLSLDRARQIASDGGKRAPIWPKFTVCKRHRPR